MGSGRPRGIKRVGGNAFDWHGRDRMLRIQRSANGEVVFTLSGQMDEEPIAQLEILINSEAKGLRIILDLKDLTLVNENAITYLERCEAKGITLKNCPAYIREWITRQRREVNGSETIVVQGRRQRED
jgi:hypothetical protein